VTPPCEQQLDAASSHTPPLLKGNWLHSTRDLEASEEFSNVSKSNRVPQDTCQVRTASHRDRNEARAFPRVGREKQGALTLAREKLSLLHAGLRFCSLKRYRMPGRQKKQIPMCLHKVPFLAHGRAPEGTLHPERLLQASNRNTAAQRSSYSRFAKKHIFSLVSTRLLSTSPSVSNAAADWQRSQAIIWSGFRVSDARTLSPQRLR